MTQKNNTQYINLCKAVKRQRQLKELKESTLDTLIMRIEDAEIAEKVYQCLQSSKEGYMKICRVWPSRGEEHQGWTFAFAEGLPLHLDTPLTWYSTSNIDHIDWNKRLFKTNNSVYSFQIQ